MRNKSILVILSTLVLLGNGCGAEQQQQVPPRPADMGRIAPGQVRILGHVVTVDSTLSDQSDDPCSRAPCTATVRVDSILGYGSGFPRPLSRGEEIRVRFGFTLGPTEDVIPSLEESYPGLEPGDWFWADVRGQPAMGPGNSQFIVYGYYSN